MTRFPILALLAVAVALAAACPALADGTPPHPRMTEKQLRAFETRLLGAEHAAEHARLRALERREAARARRHQRWLRSLAPSVRRTVERKERLRRQRANAKKRAYLQKVDASFDPAVSGKWTTAPFPLHTANGDHVMAINTAMLPTGKVLMYSYPTNPNPTYGGPLGNDEPNEATAFVWDPSKGYGTDSFSEFKPPILPETGKPANIWCSGISFNADGTILVTGGNLDYRPDWKGLDTIYTFNPFTEAWTYEGRMAGGRWYPTQQRLPDGRTVIMSGYDKSGTPAYNNDIEIYDPAKPAGSRIYKVATRTHGGNATQPPTGGLYPHNFLMPSGNVLVAGPFIEDSWYFRWNDVPTSSANNLPWTNFASVGTAFVGRTWTGYGGSTQTVTADGRDQVWGSGVIVPSTNPAAPSTKVMLLGGNYPDTTKTSQTDYAVPWTETFDDADKSAGWTATPSLNVGRGHGNTVILPDGSMVEVGGGYGIVNNNQWLTDASQHQVELWNPSTGQWTIGPAQVEGRAYHSTAALLPDGRVLSAGDDWNGSDPGGNPVQGGQYGYSDDTAEIYSPPYLFKGARPTVTHSPAAAPLGSVMSVDTPDTDVTRAALVAPAATTHANDMNQRYVALSVSQRPGGVNLTVPSDADVALPGYYMLFLINSKGVPSVATWVHVGFTTSALPDGGNTPGGTGGTTGTGAGGTGTGIGGTGGTGGTGAGKDTAAPKITFKMSSRAKYRTLLSSGLTVKVRCSEACRLTGVLDITVKVSSGKGKKSKTYVLGRYKRTGLAHASSYVTVKIKLTKSGRARLRRAHTSRVRLTITATDAAGNDRTSKRSIKVVH